MALDPANWMAQLSEKVHSLPLSCLAIPGSHDSFSYSIDKSGPIAPNTPKPIRDLELVFGSMVKDIVYHWSITQTLNITDQLKSGIRHFDLRVAPKPGSEGFFFIHGLYGLKVDVALSEIKQFLDEHPKEVIFLDFNHFYEMNTTKHQALQALIQDIFAEKLCPFLDIESVTLDMMWENNLQLLAFYHDEMTLENMMFWPGSSIPAPWPNVTDVKALLEILESNYEEGHTPGSFNVTQAILSPDATFILSHIGGSLQKDMSDKVAHPAVEWLQQKKCGDERKGINLVILDCVQEADYINSVISLNHKVE